MTEQEIIAFVAGFDGVNVHTAAEPTGLIRGQLFSDGNINLLGGTATVLAVNSYVTNSNCSGVGYGSRVDIPEVLDWIQGYLG